MKIGIKNNKINSTMPPSERWSDYQPLELRTCCRRTGWWRACFSVGVSTGSSLTGSPAASWSGGRDFPFASVSSSSCRSAWTPPCYTHTHTHAHMHAHTHTHTHTHTHAHTHTQNKIQKYYNITVHRSQTLISSIYTILINDHLQLQYLVFYTILYNVSITYNI